MGVFGTNYGLNFNISSSGTGVYGANYGANYNLGTDPITRIYFIEFISRVVRSITFNSRRRTDE